MAYKRYIWVDEESQLDAYHLNNIEDGLEGIIDGDLTVDKANKDGDGNIITGSYGSNINFEFDNSTGMVTLKLLAKDGSILQTSSIDLPTEYLIKEIYLDDIDKNLVFVLSNDTEIKCDISAIYDKIDTKVDKVEDSSTFNRAYGVDTNGKQKMFNISKVPNDSALGQYTSAGNLVTNDPTAVLHAANKRYVDGRIDYIVFNDTIFSIISTLTQTEYNDLYAFYTKHYNKDKLPLFAIDKNGSIASVSLETRQWVNFTLFSNKLMPIILSIQVDTDIHHSRQFSYGPGYLHNILGQDSWKNDVKARIGVNSDNQLIITDEAGNQTPGQEPSVLIPPFSYKLDESGAKVFTLDGEIHTNSFYYQFDNNLGVAEIISELKIWGKSGAKLNYLAVANEINFSSDVDFTDIVANITYDYYEKYFTFTFDNNTINLPSGKSGTIALIEDLANYTPISETNDIKALIPPQANKNNQLADKNFVNSSINSSAAYFIGSFATYADLLKWQNDNPTKATNNDYAYVEQDETHNNEGWRYIYVKTEEETVGTWKPQFKVNDTPFTAAQLAAINSNITSDKVTTFDNHIVNKENPHGVTKEQVGLGNVDNTSDLDKPISTATSIALENLTKVIPTDINAKSQFFYADLILEHDGKEITGQKKLAKIPAWKLLDNADYPIPLKKFMKAQFIEIINLGINGNIFFPLTSDENVVFLKRKKDTNDWYSFDVDTTVKSDKTQILLTDANTKTINGESIYGTGDIEINSVFDFTSLDFTNVLNNLSDEGYARVTIEDETLKNNLKTIFDRLQNNKTSFIEFPKLKTGAGTDETIQKTRMFALIQNSVYLGTGIYGLYGLMYFYGKNGNQDVLTEIRINTNLSTYNSIEFIDVKRNLVEKSSNKKVVYTNDNDGTPSTLNYSVTPNNSAIAQFNSTGQLYSNAPTSDMHVANKKYVDDIATNKLDVITYDDTKIMYDDNDQAPLPADLKALIKPYFDNNKPFVLILYNDTTITTYYLKGMRIATDNEITFISFDGDVDSAYTILYFDMTSNDISVRFINIAEHEDTVQYNPDVAKAVYVNNENKQQSMVAYSLLPGDSNIAQFDTNGHLYTNDPNIDSHCANKKYVDSAIENNLPYGTNADIDNMF